MERVASSKAEYSTEVRPKVGVGGWVVFNVSPRPTGQPPWGDLLEPDDARQLGQLLIDMADHASAL